jgi:hypothetical protein
MKKIILAAAAVAALGAGASAAQAKVHLNLYFGGGYGYHDVHYSGGYYVPKCHFVTVKKVKWVYGEKVIVWKKKKVCKQVYIAY